MAVQAQPYVGGGLPTNVVWVQGTTLFEVAADNLGNAMYWGAIAAINGLTDPWINTLTQLKIPIIFNKADTSGIFEPTNSSMVPGINTLGLNVKA